MGYDLAHAWLLVALKCISRCRLAMCRRSQSGDASMTTTQATGTNHEPTQTSSSKGEQCRAAQAGLAIEESQTPLQDGSGEAVGVAFLAMPCIREHQATLLEERLRCIAGRSGGRLIVSMSEVDDITSACVNSLVTVNNHCRQLGGSMAIFGLSREMHRLFKLTHLDRTMTIVADHDEAVRSFSTHGRRPWILRALSGRRKAA